MAISRPFLLALLGVALLGATVFAVQNARNGAADPAPVAQQAAQPADQAAAPAPSPAPADPQALLQAALSTEALESASFEASLSFASDGERNTVKASGAYESNGRNEMPAANVQVSVDVPGFDGRGGFVTTGARAWFTQGRTSYAVPQEAWQKIVEARESGTPPASDAPQLDVDAGAWLKNVKSEGSERMDGIEVTHVSAEVDSARAIADVAKAMDRSGQVPANAEALLADAIKNGRIDAWVGEDQILRRASLQLSGKGDGGRSVQMDLDVQLSNVNKPQDIARPANVKNGLPEGALGQVATGFVGGLGSTVGVPASELDLDVPVTNGHRKAARAVADHRKVVIFFQNPRALDDKAVAESVRTLDRRTDKLVVITDDVRNVKRYGSLVEDLGVTQAPAIVVIDRRGNASLVEGYVDAPSLAQVVADAR